MFEIPRVGRASHRWAALLLAWSGCAAEEPSADATQGQQVATAATLDALTASDACSIRNVARDPGVIVTAQSTYDGYSPLRAADGDRNVTVGPAYSWANAHLSAPDGLLPQWLEVSFPDTRFISRIDLYTSQGYPLKDFDITVWDGASWIVVQEQRGNVATSRSLPIPLTAAKKVRLIARRGPDVQPIYGRVNELELYGCDIATTQPPTITTITTGDQWRRLQLQGSLSSAAPATNETVIVLQTATGALNAPLPSGLQQELQASVSSSGQLHIVSEWVANEIRASEQQGALTQRLSAIAEPLDPSPTDASGARLFGSCSDQVQTRSRSANVRTPYSKSVNFGSGAGGSITLNGDLSGTATAEATLTRKRYRFIRWCIPYATRVDNAKVSGTLTVNQGASVGASLSYARSWREEVANIELGTVGFMIGPVPVWLRFSLPIEVALDLNASAGGTLTYVAQQTAVAQFSLVCAGNCSGSGSWTGPSLTQSNIAGSVNGRITAKPALEAAGHVALYADAVFWAEGGVRGWVNGDLWGYSGNGCGDADGDGVAEQVDALTIDLDYGIDGLWKVSTLGFGPAKGEFAIAEKHALWRQMLGNGRIGQPSVVGSGTAAQNIAQPYAVAMRSCWPYTDEVDYTLTGGATSQSFRGPAKTGTSIPVTFSSAGTANLTATALDDAHGRSIGMSTVRPVQVAAAPACIPPLASERAWFPLDELSGSTIDDRVATIDGVANAATPTLGKVAGAREFNGSNAYVSVPSHDAVNFGTGNFSIAAWLRSTDSDGGVIAAKRSNFNGAYVGFVFMVLNGRLLLQLADPANNWANFWASTAPTVNDGAWHLVAVTVDRTDPSGGKMLVDGNVVYTFDPRSRPGSLSNSAPLELGRVGYEAYLAGTLDEVELFNSALPQSELQALFNAGVSGRCK